MTEATCKFCGQTFRNKQAVRAHLKGCSAYRQMPKAPRRPLGSQAARTGLGNRPLVPSRSPAAIPTEHRSLPPPRRTSPQPVQAPYTKELRRSVIQSVKNRVIGSYWSVGHTIPSETKAQALAAIERELSELPVDQLPRSEVEVIAEGIRDRFYKPVIQAQQRAREDEERRRNQARQRSALIAVGIARANHALRQQGDLDSSTRLTLEVKAKRVLEQEIDGSESEADVQARVDDLLAEQLEAVREARREQGRQQLIAHGKAYLRQQLAPEEDLSAWECKDLERNVTQDLEKGVTGEESEADVEDYIDEVLAEVLGDTNEEDGEDDGDEEDDEDEEDENDE